MIELVPMTDADFRRYMETAVEDYAQAHLKAGDCEPGDALERARADYDALLPQGLASAGQHLFTVRTGAIEGPIGMVWFALRERGAKKSAYIYDIQIDAAHRGHGYGEQALKKTEDLAASMGAARISLNVMGWNHAARSLYDKAGFSVTGIGMTKSLT